MAFIDNIVKFHTFSKSTVRPDLTLGEAVNPSGHTVTSKQVRTDDIPAFINSFKDNKTDALAWAAANVDAYVRHNDILYYGANFNMGFDKPSCLKRVAKQEVNGKLVDLPKEQHTWVDFDLTSATKLPNADGKDVIEIHRDAKICYVHKDNNASTNSNENSAFIKKADGTFLDHFVAPTDQFVGGQPSLGYGLCLFKENYNSGKAFSEGESTYIGNAFAGLIHFMTTRTESSDKSKNYEIAGFSVNCFEYIGDKLDATIDNLTNTIKDVVDVSLGEVVANIDTTDAATNAGLSIIDTNDTGAGSKTSPQIAFTEGSITNDETKLVSGKTVKTYVDAVSTEQKIWNLNQFFNENCTRDDITWIKEVLEYKSSDGEQLVYFQQANTYASQSDTSNKDKGSEAVKRHKDVADAWINYVKQNGHAPFELVFKKDSYRINELIRHMFAQLDKDAGVDYLSADSISKRCMKPGLSVKYVTVLNNGESYDPFGSNIDLDLGVVDDVNTDSQKFYPSFTISTWHGKTRFNSGDSILDRNEPASIRTAGANSFLNATNDSFMRAYNWTYTVNEQEHKFIVDAIKTGGSISQSIQEKITEAITTDITGDDLTVTGSGITVTLGGQVGTPTLTGSVEIATYTPATAEKAGYWTDDTNVTTGAEVAKAIADVNNKIATLHSSAVTYQVFATKPAPSEEFKGIIALIPVAEGESAVAGDYVEWLCVEKEGEGGAKSYSWEQIGTTAANLTQYAKSVTVNGTKTPVTTSTGDINIGKVASSVAEGTISGSITDAGVLTLTVDTVSLVENDALKTAITGDDVNKLVTAADALEAIKLAKPENYVASVTGYTTEGTEVTTTQGAEIKVLDGRGTTVTANDLWGTTATMDENGVVTVDHKKIVYGGREIEDPWNTSVASVEDNKAYGSDGAVIANIQTDMIKKGRGIFYGTNIASFNGDLSSLTDGAYMFCDSKITSFDGNLSSLTDGTSMFHECFYLTSFDGDLSSLRDGDYMFYQSKLTSFNGDLSSLTDAFGMFYQTKLKSFVGDLSSLRHGSHMFSHTYLTSIASDLSSLTDGSSMFRGCSSLETFTSDLSSLTNGSLMFYETKLASFCGDLSSLTNGMRMFQYATNLASFCGDLSSLTDGSRMFYETKLASFCGDLSSLDNGTDMFYGCELDTESVECIAETINTSNSSAIGICIKNGNPNEREHAAFGLIHSKGWRLYVDGSTTPYVPTEGEAKLDETGESTVAPKPYWAKPIEVTEEEAQFVGEDGKFYQVVGGQFIYVSDPDTYGMFTSREDAIANMRLTKYVKPTEEA